LRLYDMTDPQKPAIAWQDWPVLRAFRPSRSTRSTQEFWELVGRDGDFVQPAGSYKTEAVDNNRWSRDDIKNFFERRITEPDAKAWTIMYGHMDIDQRRLHPMERARTFIKSLRSIARVLSSNEVEDRYTGEKVDLNRGVRRQLTDIIDEISRREYRNALIVMQRPGYENKTIQPVEPYLKELETLSPATYGALMKDITFKTGEAKVYDFETVQRLWPEMRERLLNPDIQQRIIDAEGQIELDLFAAEAAMAQATGIR